MTLTIDLPDEQTAALAAKARAQGLSTEQYVRQVLEHDVAPEWLQKSWQSAREAGLDQLSVEDIDAEISAAWSRCASAVASMPSMKRSSARDPYRAHQWITRRRLHRCTDESSRRA